MPIFKFPYSVAICLIFKFALYSLIFQVCDSLIRPVCEVRTQESVNVTMANPTTSFSIIVSL